MFGRYALPDDDLAQNMSTITASAEDPEYEALNAVVHTARRPAKLTTLDGYWDLVFPAPITVGAIHIVYPNFDDGLDVTLEPDGGTPIQIDIISPWENDWYISPIQEFAQQTSDTWRLSINEDNGTFPQVAKILLYSAMRDLENDVRWGVIEQEEQGDVAHITDGGAMNVAEIWGPQRSFSGEFHLQDDKASELIRLHRTAKNRIHPWTLWPEAEAANNNDGWWVRFEEITWARTRQNPNHNIFPFRVKEVARGLPWP
jgi:hypothetical protein